MIEVWFTYGTARRWRVCANEQERDDALAFLQGVQGVSDIDVVN